MSLPSDLGIDVHDVIGWHRCANIDCLQELEVDHVVLLTTAHMRRFCSVECIGQGKEAWDDVIGRSAYDGISVKESLRRRLRTSLTVPPQEEREE